MTKPSTKQEFADYVLRRLGAPIVNVEITDMQLEDIIDEAVQYYQDWHYEGTQRSYRAICLDQNFYDGNNRRAQCITAEYYDPDKEYRVGDRVRATIDKDQGERIWIKFDSEQLVDQWKFVEYPNGDWFKENGVDLFVLYDSDTANVFVFDSDSLGLYTKFNDEYVLYDSDLHVPYNYDSEVVTVETDTNNLFYRKVGDSDYIEAATTTPWTNARFVQTFTVLPNYDENNQFVVNIIDDPTLNPIPVTLQKTADTDTFTFRGPGSAVVDSDGLGTLLPSSRSLETAEIELQVTDSEVIITTTLLDNTIKTGVLEPIPYGTFSYVGKEGQQFVNVNNVVNDSEYTLVYTPDSDNPKLGSWEILRNGAPDDTTDGIFIGENPLWLLRGSGDSEYAFDSDVFLQYSNSLEVDSETIKNIPDFRHPTDSEYVFDSDAPYSIPLVIDDSESFVGYTYYKNLEGLAVFYDTDTTAISLISWPNDSDATIPVDYGTGAIIMPHPDDVLTSLIPDKRVITFFQGVYDSDLSFVLDSDSEGNLNDSDAFRPLKTPKTITVLKDGVQSNTFAETVHSNWPDTVSLNWNTGTNSFSFMGIDSDTNLIDLTAAITVKDVFEFVDSETMVAFLDGIWIDSDSNLILEPDTNVIEETIPVVSMEIKDRTETGSYKGYDFTFYRNSDITPDFHDLYERELLDNYEFASRTAQPVSLLSRTSRLDGIRYIRLDQEAQREYDFKDLWALEQAVLSEPELDLDYSKTGQVGIPIPEDIHSVVKCFRMPVGHFGSTFGSFQFQMMINHMGWYHSTLGAQWGFITDLHIHSSYLELIEQTLNIQPAIRFNKHKNRLYIDTYYDRLEKAGVDYLMLEVYEISDPEVFGNVYKDSWLKRYATALAKIQWGSNLRKFSGTDLPGGIQINGEEIYQEGKEDRDALEEQMRNTFMETDSIILG